MKVNTIRAFIAIELPRELRAGIDSVIQRLKDESGQTVRWVPSSNIHLTIKFLGEVLPPDLDLIIRSIDQVANRYPFFRVQIGGLGVFPGIRRPRVIWIGITAPEELPKLSCEIENACKKLGFPLEGREFSPHLTIGRVRQFATDDGIRSLSELIARTRVGHLGDLTVDGISLIQSDLRPAGPIYTLLHKSHLSKSQSTL